MYEVLEIVNCLIDDKTIANRIETIANDLEQQGIKNSDYIEELSLYYFHYYNVYKKYEKRITFILDSLSEGIKSNFSNFGLVDLESEMLSFDLGSKYKLVAKFLENKMKDKKVMRYQNGKKFDSHFLLNGLMSITKFDLLIMVPDKKGVKEYVENITEIFKSSDDVRVITSSNSERTEGKKNIYVLTPDKILNVCKNGCSIQIDYMIWEQNHLADNKAITGFIFDMILKSVNRCYPNIYYIITNDLFYGVKKQTKDNESLGFRNKDSQESSKGNVYILNHERNTTLNGQIGNYSFAANYDKKY